MRVGGKTVGYWRNTISPASFGQPAGEVRSHHHIHDAFFRGLPAARRVEGGIWRRRRRLGRDHFVAGAGGLTDTGM